MTFEHVVEEKRQQIEAGGAEKYHEKNAFG